MRILIIEDDPRICSNLFDFLEAGGHQCAVAGTLRDAQQRLTDSVPDAIVLDLNLPDGDGLTFARQLHSTHSSLPVLMLTARDTLDDKLAGFAAGADDYLVKPFALREVEVRLQALHRRASPRPDQGLWHYGPLEYDAVAQEVRLDGQPLRLAPKALRLLALFLQDPHRLLPRSEIERAVWGQEQEASDNLRSLLHVIRRELASSDHVEIENLHGQGYRLVIR